MRYLLTISFLTLFAGGSFFAGSSFAQQTLLSKTADELFPQARNIKQHALFTLDPARDIKIFDASPTGNHWFVASAFADWERMTIDGKPIDQNFHAISGDASRISPNNKYTVWVGLVRGYTTRGFDSTTAYVYQGDSLIGHYVADYPKLQYSRTGDRYAVLLPYAYQAQTGLRDVVIVDGKLVDSGKVSPSQFSFSHDERSWAYRSSDGENERLITSSGQNIFMYKHATTTHGVLWDPTIWRYTPDVKDFSGGLTGRDYDLDFTHVARQYRTAYSSLSRDTVRTWLTYDSDPHQLYRWINNIVIDTAGDHIAYFACDPAVTHAGEDQNEHLSVVVMDGKIISPIFPELSRLFLSPTGKHYAFTSGKNEAQFYLDGKLTAKTSQVIACKWSPNEKKVALIAVGRHNKYFVVINGKRSPLLDRIGRMQWDPAGRFVEFCGIINARLIRFKFPA